MLEEKSDIRSRLDGPGVDINKEFEILYNKMPV